MRTLLTGLTIWDGTKLLDADTLTFSNGRIDAIGASGDLAKACGDLEKAGGEAIKPDRTIDCRGLTALPGLIDAHVHLELNPDEKDAPIAKKLKRARLTKAMEERAEAMVRAGITAARDLGGGAWLELDLRDRIAAGELVGPRLICSGQPITSSGGHCHFWGGEAANLTEAKAVLARQVAKRVDLIKVMATGGRLTRGTDPQKPQFDVATLTGIVEAARGHQLPVAAHCHGTEGIRIAAMAGVNTIEHCSWVGEAGWASDYQAEVAELIAERGIWVSPTVNRGWQRMLNSDQSEVLQRVRHAYRQMLGSGVPFIASTDAGIPGVYHHHLPHALAVFAEIAQLTPERTLRASTADAATALGLQSVTGRLAPGLAADILLVHGKPLENLAALKDPAAVWARGRDVVLPN